MEIKTEKEKVKKRLDEIKRQNAPMQKRLDEVTKKVRELENSTRELVSVKKKKKVKSAYEPSGPPGRSLSRFPWHEATRNISTPPWMGCQSIAGLPPALNSPVPIYTPGWREAP